MKTAREIIETYDGPHVRIMEVCGTHTHEIFRLGIRKLLPEQVELISGPGCPVCVTPVSFIDEAIYLALEKRVTICTFGDLVRVPGTKMSLACAREQGAKVRIVYSPADAEKYAKEHRDEQVVFLSVGFETTTPAGCLSVKAAKEDGCSNYSILTANKTMPQAYEALKGSADVFLYPGHVNAITGTHLCETLAEEGISGVVAGFTAKELMTAEEYAAVLTGTKQYVMLGAGLDTFAFREKEFLSKHRVFEVDHPLTQKDKIERITRAGCTIPDNLTFVPADFTKDNVAERLIDGG